MNHHPHPPQPKGMAQNKTLQTLLLLDARRNLVINNKQHPKSFVFNFGDATNFSNLFNLYILIDIYGII